MISKKILGSKTAVPNFIVVVSSTRDSIMTISIDDISSSISPVFLSELIDTTNLNGAYDVAVDYDNKIAYVACANLNGVSSVDISNPSSMSILDTVTSGSGYLNNASIIKLDVTNEVAWVTDHNGSRLTSIDISNPSSLSILDCYVYVSTNSQNDPQVNSSMVLNLTENNKIFVRVDSAARVRMYDPSNPSSIVYDDQAFYSDFDSDYCTIHFFPGDDTMLMFINPIKDFVVELDISYDLDTISFNNPDSETNLADIRHMKHFNNTSAGSYIYGTNYATHQFKIFDIYENYGDWHYGVEGNYTNSTYMGSPTDFELFIQPTGTHQGNKCAAVLSTGTTNYVTFLNITYAAEPYRINSLSHSSIAGIHGLATSFQPVPDGW